MNFNNIKTKVLATKVEKREGYSLVMLRDSRHDKKTDTWKRSPYPGIHFAASAQAKIDELIEALGGADKFEDGNSKGVWIVLKSASLTNEVFKNKEGVDVYPKQFTVWDWEFFVPEEKSDAQDETPIVEESSNEEELPF